MKRKVKTITTWFFFVGFLLIRLNWRDQAKNLWKFLMYKYDIIIEKKLNVSSFLEFFLREPLEAFRGRHLRTEFHTNSNMPPNRLLIIIFICLIIYLKSLGILNNLVKIFRCVYPDIYMHIIFWKILNIILDSEKNDEFNYLFSSQSLA